MIASCRDFDEVYMSVYMWTVAIPGALRIDDGAPSASKLGYAR